MGTSATALTFKGIAAGFVAAFVYLFGGWSIVLQIVITVIVIDYVTGLISAAINKKLSSEIGFRGILKKILLLVAVAFAHQLDLFFNLGDTIRNVICIIFIANEGISVFENLALGGVKLPKFIIDALVQVRELTEKQAENILKSRK